MSHRVVRTSVYAAIFALAIAACTAGYTNGPTHIRIHLNDSAPATELVDLSFPLVFRDRMGHAQLAKLPSGLSIDDSETMDRYAAGDVAYWASEKSLVVFLSNGAGVPAEGLHPVGHITEGLDGLVECRTNCAVFLQSS